MWCTCCPRCKERIWSNILDPDEMGHVICDFCGEITTVWDEIFLAKETRKDIPIFFDDYHCGEILEFASQLRCSVSEYLEDKILTCIDDVLGKRPPGQYQLSERELDIILDGFAENVVAPSKSSMPKSIREGLWKVVTFYLAKNKD